MPIRFHSLITILILSLFSSCILSPGQLRERREAAAFADTDTPDYIPDLTFVRVPGTGYWISEKPSSLEDLWAVYYGRDGLAGGLSYDDAEKLLDRLYLTTGIPARIARESDYLTAREAGVVAAPTENDSFLLSGRWPVYESDGTFTILDSMAILWAKCERMLIERGMKGKENRYYITIKQTGK